MKVYRLYVLLASVCLSAVAAVALIAYGDRAVVSLPSPSSQTTSSTTLSTAPKSGYILGPWNGKLALYAAGNPYPKEVYDIFVRSFPEEEQTRLEQGIPAATEAELEELLEDYSG